MGKRSVLFLLVSFFIFLFLLPSVRANSGIYYISGISITNILILFSPVVLIETAGAYLLVHRYFRLETNFLRILLIFFTANVVSTVIGIIFYFAGEIPLPPVASPLVVEVGTFIEFFSQAIFFLFLYFLPITFIIEFPIVYVFMRTETEAVLKESAIVDVLANVISYIFLGAILVLFGLSMMSFS